MSLEDKTVIQSLVGNALDFFLVATEDVRTGDKRRLKASLSHLTTAVELLLKAKLYCEHWSLIFQDVDKAARAHLASGDFKSVDFETTLRRLHNISSVDMKPFLKHLRQLRRLRNRVLHFSVDVGEDQMKSLLAKGCDFATEFYISHIAKEVDLHSDPFSAVAEKLREFREFVTARLESIKPKLENAALLWSCPRCWQDSLVIGDAGPRCPFCGYETEAALLAHEASEGSVRGCPHCDAETCALVISNNDEASWVCFSCGELEADERYYECFCCGRLTLNDGMCDSCWAEGLRD